MGMARGTNDECGKVVVDDEDDDDDDDDDAVVDDEEEDDDDDDDDGDGEDDENFLFEFSKTLTRASAMKQTASAYGIKVTE